MDESFFGARRVKGKRGRGVSGKTIVFGIFQRNGQVYTEIVPDCSKATLQAIIRGRVSPESIIYSDGWRGYTGLDDMGYKKHLRIDDGLHEFVRGSTHINGIESYWGLAKTRLAKFRGLSPRKCYLHLKECKWCYNHRHEDQYRLLTKMLVHRPLN